MRVVINIEKYHTHLIILAIVLVTGAFLAAGAAPAGTSTHKTLFTDSIKGKSGDNIAIMGNTGVWTATPQYPLDVNGAFAARDNVEIGHIPGVSGGVFITKTATYGKPAIQAVTPAFGFEQLALNPGGGNVGIGTSSPAEKLDVAGNIKATGFCIGADCKTSISRGGLLAIRTYDSSATWSKPSGLAYVVVDVWGAGGGGGGSNPGSGNGGTGTSSSFGSYVSASGGQGGSNVGGYGGGRGGAGTDGDLNIIGQAGQLAWAGGGGMGGASPNGGAGGQSKWCSYCNSDDMGLVPGGAGAGGANMGLQGAPGGGAGGYAKKRIDASALTATVPIAIGAGGAGGSGHDAGGIGANGMIVVYEYN